MILFLGLTGVLLDRAFVNSQIAAQSERLFIRVFNLLSVAEPDDVSLTLPRALREERFNSPESGLVGLVLDENRQTVWESLSSEWFTDGDWVRSLDKIDSGAEEFGLHRDWIYQRNGFTWEVAKDEDRYFEFWVLESAEPLNRAIQTFRGETNQLTGRYPKELTPLTNSLNQLLIAEQGQRERYRKAMADLAHSLKTPLAVMRAVNSESSVEINEQVDRMDQIVRYQLQRAVADASHGPVLGQRCDLSAAIERIGSALEKAFLKEDKSLDLPDRQTNLFVAMDSNDVLEILGNLLENGFKYGRSIISVQLENRSSTIIVHVDDDGPGIDENKREEVLTRGKRLDTMQPGQGIGLAMVNDILASYRVELMISRSPLGGARFSLALPLSDIT
ncbi:MAG: ATP-binding protein [Reinekea sp.]